MREAIVLSLILAFAPLVGCITGPTGDALEETSAVDADAVAEWARDIPPTVLGVAPIAHASDVEEGAGIWMDGDHAFVTGRSQGVYVLDVSAPEKPVVVARITENDLYARDADVKRIDGKRIVAFAGANQGIHIVDATDAAAPELLVTRDLEKGSHNVAFHPTETLLFNSNSWGEGTPNEILDVSNPADPQVIGTFGNYGCHDITFFLSESKNRLYCPGIELTEIWDIQDPRAPTLVVQIENEAARSYGLGLHHSAMTRDGKLLIIGDEFDGGTGPGCHANANGESTPLGALWFYDVSDEKTPKLLSYVSPNAPLQAYAETLPGASPNPGNPISIPFEVKSATSCTSHFGNFVPGHDMLVVGWYRAGVILIDFSEPADPVIVDQWNEGTDTWDVKVHNGLVFTGDMARGLDVLEFKSG